MAFNPRGSRATYTNLYAAGPFYPTVQWGWKSDPAESLATSLVRYQGAQGSGLYPGQLYLKAKVEPVPGYSLPSGTRIEDFNSRRFVGWSVSRVSSTELIYTYGSAERNATTLDLMPPGGANPPISSVPGVLFYATKHSVDELWRFRIEVGAAPTPLSPPPPKVTPAVYYFQTGGL
jgi:hypothetical protein